MVERRILDEISRFANLGGQLHVNPNACWYAKVEGLYLRDSHTSQLVSFLVRYVYKYPRSLA